MSRCPECRSIRVIVVVSPDPHMVCSRCGAAWTQDEEGVVSIQPPLDASLERGPSATDSGPIPWASG